MRKAYEKIKVVYYYDSLEERSVHLHNMESEGWKCTEKVRELKSLHDSSLYEYVGEYIKYV